MKRYWKMMVITAVCVFVVDWMIIGIKLLDHDHDILLEAYVAGACWLVVCCNSIYTTVQRYITQMI